MQATATINPPLMRQGFGAMALILIMLAMMVLPLPPILLDLAFSFNIALALVVILATVYILSPVDFASFPTVLLVATLLRLALNVASTRVVLLHGHNGGAAAGKVIQSFGEVVIGGNYTVGFVVFVILVVINFVVVTKGAGRISEVSARFTLDALPGKQMAIDADLNTGVITQDEAKARREAVGEEADFYGAMDGASKFVRGDAIAGIIILFINIIGGLTIGTIQHNLSFGDALKNYALLTIGDGLVAQVPALLLSIAAAIMVTRVSKAQDMSQQVLSHLFHSRGPLLIAGAILLVMGIVPGMPHVAFMGLSGVMFMVAYYIGIKREAESQAQVEAVTDELNEGVTASNADELKELTWSDVPSLDTVSIEIGYRLIPLVDKGQNGALMHRVRGVRKKLSSELGFLIPTVHISDNLELPANKYRISIMGVIVAEAQIMPDKHLAINPGQVFGKLKGVATTDPAFGLEAVWIDDSQKEQAQNLGYTVVDASTVVATHLSQLLTREAARLLGHNEAQHMLDNLAKTAPNLVEDLAPKAVPLSTVVKVLQNLLNEQVPIRDLRTIAEKILEFAGINPDPQFLTAMVRVGLADLIIQNLVGHDQELQVATIEPQLEQILQQSANGDNFIIEPGLGEQISNSLRKFIDRQAVQQNPAVLVVTPNLRPHLATVFRNMAQELHIISYQEIPATRTIQIVSQIGND